MLLLVAREVRTCRLNGKPDRHCFVLGKLFGAGVYFASKAGDASRYAPAERNEEKTMFYCDVLVGLYTKGDPSMIEPPPIDPSINATDRYDSTVNDTSNPSIFVSCYRDYMAYPKYLITFR